MLLAIRCAQRLLIVERLNASTRMRSCTVHGDERLDAGKGARGYYREPQEGEQKLFAH